MNIKSILNTCHPKTFLAVNFGCRVNAAETNLFSQLLIKNGFSPLLVKGGDQGVGLIIINTCSITAKANIESLGKIRSFCSQFPNSQIIVTGCACPATAGADISNLKNFKNIIFLTNSEKELLLKPLHSSYTHKIKDKFSHTHRFILKIQSGCNHGCTYCVVPSRRPDLWSLPINNAIDTVNQAVKNGYEEIIITGINLDLYEPGLSHLLESLLTQTTIPLISFGSIPLNCLDDKFINLIKNSKFRIKNYLHIPLQSGSDKILNLMHRPYNNLKIKKLIKNCKLEIKNLLLGTDIIVGFPGETDFDFQQTYDLCKEIGFSKIHVFKFSPRPGTQAQKLFDQSPKVSKSNLKLRSAQLRKLSPNN